MYGHTFFLQWLQKAAVGGGTRVHSSHNIHERFTNRNVLAKLCTLQFLYYNIMIVCLRTCVCGPLFVVSYHPISTFLPSTLLLFTEHLFL